MKSSYDQDGYFVLHPKKCQKKDMDNQTDTSRILLYNKNEIRVGECFLYKMASKIVPTVGRTSQYKVTPHNMDGESGYIVTDYAPKAWQNKAWKLIRSGINWKKSSEFKNCVNSRELKHLKRLGLMIRVRAEDEMGNNVTNLYCMAEHGDDRYPYIVVDTMKEFKSAMNELYHILYVNIDSYLEICRNKGLDFVTVSCKALAVYDDYTFDHISGDPRKIFDKFNITFNDRGRIKL